MDSNLSRTELESTLAGLVKLYEQNRRTFEVKRAEAVKITGEMAAIAEVGKGLTASMNAIKKELGLPLDEKPQPAAGPPSEGEIDVTLEVMRIIADHQDKGGIDIDDISAELTARGIAVSSRDYLHTILNRKKNKQKKLIRVDGKWFLTDKGKAEVKMRSE